MRVSWVVLLGQLFCTCVLSWELNPSADPTASGVRFQASWWDEIEAGIDVMLSQGAARFAFLGEDALTMGTNVNAKSVFEAGFNRTLSNHNLASQPSMRAHVVVVAASRAWTLANLRVTALYTPQTVLPLKFLFLSPDCPAQDATWLTFTSSINARTACVALVPALPGTYNITALAFGWRDALVSSGSEASLFDTTAAVAARSLLPSSFASYLHMASNTNLTLGPFLDGVFACSQALRQVWVYNTSLVVEGVGVSNRSVCGAPSTLLPANARSVVLAQSAAFSGPNAYLGIGMRAGLRAAFALSPYIGNRRLILLSADDGYDPIAATSNALNMTQGRDGRLFAFVGFTGTPTSQATYPVVKPTGLPFVCAFTGARFLHQPYDRQIVNVRSSYDDETEAMTQFLIARGLRTIALFRQNDSFGQAGKDGLTLALGRRGLTVFAEASYTRNTVLVESGVQSLIDAGRPEAVVMVGTASALAKFVSLARLAWPVTPGRVDVLYLAVSFVGTDTFQQALGANRTGVIVTQVVPPDSPAPGFYQWVSNEGFLCGRLLVEALKRTVANVLGAGCESSAPGVLNTNTAREVVPADFLNTVYDYGLFHVSTSPEVVLGPYSNNCSQGLRQVWITVLEASGATALNSTVTIDGCGVDVNSPVLGSILLAQTAVFSGDNANLGINMRDGINAAFFAINKAGGVSGRVLKLASLDDGYTPAPALANAQALAQLPGVFAFIGVTGTPTSRVVVPFATANHIPFIAPFTGARFLRSPFDANVINVRASYDDEVEAFVRYCMATGLTRISIFWQNDSFGQSGVDALNVAMANEGLFILSNATYERNTIEIRPGFQQLQNFGIVPEALVMIGTADALAELVALAKSTNGWQEVVFMTVSFVGSERFATRLYQLNALSTTPGVNNRVFVTQVVPTPNSAEAVVAAFVRDLYLYCPTCEPSFGALEGYIGGRFVISALQRMSAFSTFVIDDTTDFTNNLTMAAFRQAFLDTVYHAQTFLIDGFQLGPFANKSPCIAGQPGCCSQGSHRVYFSYPNATAIAAAGGQADSSDYALMNRWQYDYADCNSNINQISSELVPLVFGQSASFSGIAATLGVEMRKGIVASFLQANAGPTKGVRARKLTLLSYDDGYEPTNTTRNVASMLAPSPYAVPSRPRVFSLVGSTGTPTTQAIFNTLQTTGVPLVGPFTGARFLRSPFVRNLVNVRASYDDEVANMVEYLLGNGRTHISIFYQADAFGQAGFDALNLSLSYHKLPLHSRGQYPRNTVNVEAGLTQLFDVPTPPDAVIMIGTALPLAKFVRLAAMRPGLAGAIWYFSVSFVGSEAFAQALGDVVVSERVYVCQVVVPPGSTGSSWDTLLNNYYSALTLIDPESYLINRLPSFGSVEGYLVGRLLIQALTRSADLTVADFLDSLYTTGTYTIDGVAVGPFSDHSVGTVRPCNQGLHSTYLSMLGECAGALTTSETATPGQVFTNATFCLQYSTVATFGVPAAQCGVFYSFADLSCPNGTMKQYTSATTMAYICDSCPPGTYGTGSQCVSCVPGSVSAGAGSATCQFCSPGYFQDRPAQTVCLACDFDAFEPRTNSSQCIKCPNGGQTANKAATNQTSCECTSTSFLALNDQGVLFCFPCPNPTIQETHDAADCQYVPFEPSMSLRDGVLAGACIAIAISISLMAAVHHWRNHPRIRAHSPNFLMMILCGSIVAYCVVFVLYPYPATLAGCAAEPLLGHVGFSLLFGALFIKNYRIARIFAADKLTQVHLRDPALFKWLFAITVVVVAYWVIWMIAAMPTPEFGHYGSQSFTWCTSPSKAWTWSIMVIEIVSLVYGGNIVVSTRKVTKLFNESKSVAAVLYNAVLMGGFCIFAIYQFVKTPDDYFLIEGVGIIVVTLVAIGAVLLPKFIRIIPGFAGNSSEDTSGEKNSAGKHSGAKTSEGGTTTAKPHGDSAGQNHTNSDVGDASSPAGSPAPSNKNARTFTPSNSSFNSARNRIKNSKGDSVPDDHMSVEMMSIPEHELPANGNVTSSAATAATVSSPSVSTTTPRVSAPPSPALSAGAMSVPTTPQSTTTALIGPSAASSTSNV